MCLAVRGRSARLRLSLLLATLTRSARQASPSDVSRESNRRVNVTAHGTEAIRLDRRSRRLRIAVLVASIAVALAGGDARAAGGADQCHKGSPTSRPKRNGTPCDDGDACTANDSCTMGVCGGTVLPGCRLDLQSCFAARGSRKGRLDIALDDGSGPRPFHLSSARRACAPAAGTTALHDALSHLTCSPISSASGGPFVRRNVATHDRFGAHTFSVLRPRELCAPSWRAGSPQTTQLDHYACYPVHGKGPGQQLTLTDERGTTSLDVERPLALCVPVSVGGSAVHDGKVLLTCYDARGLGSAPSPVDVTLENELGSEVLRLGDRQRVCVPTTVDACAQLTFTTSPGSASCGGQSFNPPPSPPFAGALFDAAAGGGVIANLGGGCAYFGGGDSEYFPAAQPSTGDTLHFDVTGCSGDLLPLVGSPGGDAAHCIGGPSNDVKVCLNDTTRSCSTDTDCPLSSPYAGVYAFAGRCAQAPRCFAGAPFPFFSSLANACVVPISSASATGSVRPATGEVSYSLGSSNVVYLDLNDLFATNPCPRCIAGMCSGGARDGKVCTPTTSLNSTSTDCLPKDEDFFTFVPAGVASFTTAPRSLGAANGLLCQGQVHPGAFGEEDVRRIELSGTPAGSLLDLAPHPATFLTLGCAPASGDPMVDSLADLPGPAASSVTGVLQMQQ